ncbi:unnamed protein product [Cyprideis torosa]|uniref:Uncharacterized protein n=1 Tax=Cyprideis torosa TaxID=163714 RepID=A0A7R8WEL8_9CRUS|nr:unnamed protein product [Cyprideis torosa]CAG0889638.1 unnamed protein product [Cyprideis torosa]
MIQLAIFACLCADALASSGYYVVPRDYKAEPLQGQYSWVAPDGDKFTVKYSANPETGYVANVEREEAAVQIKSKSESKEDSASNEASASIESSYAPPSPTYGPPQRSYAPPRSYFSRRQPEQRFSSESREQQIFPESQEQAFSSESREQSPESQSQERVGYELRTSHGKPVVVKTYTARPQPAQERIYVQRRRSDSREEETGNRRPKILYLQKLESESQEQRSPPVAFIQQYTSDSRESAQSQSQEARSYSYASKTIYELPRRSHPPSKQRVVYVKQDRAPSESESQEQKSVDSSFFESQEHKSKDSSSFESQEHKSKDSSSFESQEHKSEHSSSLESQEQLLVFTNLDSKSNGRVVYKQVASKYFDDANHRIVFITPVQTSRQATSSTYRYPPRSTSTSSKEGSTSQEQHPSREHSASKERKVYSYVKQFAQPQLWQMERLTRRADGTLSRRQMERLTRRADGTPNSLADGTPNSQADGTPNSQADGTPNSQADGTPNSQADGTPNSQAFQARAI